MSALTCFCIDEGAVYGWGEPSNGKLASAEALLNNPYIRPTRISSVPDIKDISCGGDHTILLDSTFPSHLLTFSTLHIIRALRGMEPRFLVLPFHLTGFCSVVFALTDNCFFSLSLACVRFAFSHPDFLHAKTHFLATGSLWSFGSNNDGQLGRASALTFCNTPMSILGIDDEIKSISAGNVIPRHSSSEPPQANPLIVHL